VVHKAYPESDDFFKSEAFDINDSVINGECSFYVYNSISSVGYFDNCKKSKKWEFYGGGRLARISTYKDDLLSGPTINIFPENKYDTIIYNKGLVYNYRCSNNAINIKNENNFSNGNGVLTTLEDSPDSLEIITYSNVIKNGQYQLIDGGGNIVAIGNYKYGIEDGKWLCRLHRFSSQLKIQFSSFSKVQHSNGVLYPSA
jgi:antitoxin component YwqK of YwqJK toxin-antitoxin module